ncbi:hypothetical protein V8E51_014117 [Hyaloscypha variabilis]
MESPANPKTSPANDISQSQTLTSSPSDHQSKNQHTTPSPPRTTPSPQRVTEQQHQAAPATAIPCMFYCPENYSNVRDTPGSDDAKIEENPLKYLSNTQRGAEMSSKHTSQSSSSAQVKEYDAVTKSASREDDERMGMRGGGIGSQSEGGNMNFGGSRIGITDCGRLGGGTGGVGLEGTENGFDHESESFDVRMRALENAISESRNRIARLERDIERLEAEIEELQDRVERIEEGILKLEGEEKGQESSDIGEDRKGGKNTGSDASLD